MENIETDRFKKIEYAVKNIIDIIDTMLDVVDVQEGVWEEHDRWELKQCQKKLKSIKENWENDDEAI